MTKIYRQTAKADNVSEGRDKQFCSLDSFSSSILIILRDTGNIVKLLFVNFRAFNSMRKSFFYLHGIVLAVVISFLKYYGIIVPSYNLKYKKKHLNIM